MTHDVDEAIYLSDRIAIMRPRPGRIESIVEVEMPHPRDRESSDFATLRHDILHHFDLFGRK